MIRYPQDLRLSPEDPRMLYDGKVTFMKNQHLGQLKLFSNELEFMLSFVCTPDTRKKIVLYIGAGPGNHLVYLTKMFPTVEWHLFDCRFDDRLRTIKNVQVFQRYFLEEDTIRYSELNKDPNIDLFLISDIRDMTYDSKNWSAKEELKLLKDLELQRSWVVALKPKVSMLKFRLPFPEPEVFSLVGGETIRYLDGIIYKQPWSRGKSIETRLVVPIDKDGTFPEKVYDLSKYEQQMFYHNAILRQNNYQFPLRDSLIGTRINKILTINSRYDCAYTLILLYNYFTRVGESNMKPKIIKILDFVSRGEKN